jgi:HEPN domain-containing protein/predicted nucleotidyltransferase
VADGVAMKASTDHLPETKREKLAAIAERIRAEAPAAGMIVLFGSHARGDWVEDAARGYRSDYDLLVVVESPEVAEDHGLWARVEAAVRPIAAPSPVTLIVHDLRELNQQIRRGQFFFAEVWEQGVVLYDSRRFTLARPKATTPEERKALAEEYFEHWFKSAGTFFKTFRFLLGEGDFAIAAFQLHQATERYFATALLVFNETKPRTHDLEELGNMAAALHPLLAEPFPRATLEDERLFKLLKRAYIEARYSKSYQITAEELGTLGERVKDLAGRVERACREKIEGLC